MITIFPNIYTINSMTNNIIKTIMNDWKSIDYW